MDSVSQSICSIMTVGSLFIHTAHWGRKALLATVCAVTLVVVLAEEWGVGRHTSVCFFLHHMQGWLFHVGEGPLFSMPSFAPLAVLLHGWGASEAGADSVDAWAGCWWGWGGLLVPTKALTAMVVNRRLGRGLHFCCSSGRAGCVHTVALVGQGKQNPSMHILPAKMWGIAMG